MASKNWLALASCRPCGSLWVGVPYEPYASFTYYVLWPKSEEAFENEAGIGGGRDLHAWHKDQLKQSKSTLTEADWNAIEHHRNRSYGRDPFSDLQD